VRLRAAQQLFLSYLVLVGVVIAALSIGADSVLRNQLIQISSEDLRRELLLGRSLYENVPELAADSVADLLGALSGRRVTIVAPDGAVTGDSQVASGELHLVENHGARGEIQRAFAGELGYDLRSSQTVGIEHLYMAVQTGRGDVIRFAVPTADLDLTLSRVQRTIFSVGAGALVLALAFSIGFSLMLTRRVRGIGVVAREMTHGDLSRRVPRREGDELGDLGDALNTLADELQRRLAQLEGERFEMQALIDSMAEGVLAFSADGLLHRANPAARRIFSLPAHPTGTQPEAVDRRPDFLRIVSEALAGESVSPTELSHGTRQLLVTGHPLPQGGAVLVFLDVSELRRLEGVRRDFVANASHELKTPLTAIRGYSETLLEDDLPLLLRRQFAETVRLNADRLQRIIDDLLDLSRLESGGWKVEPERLELEVVGREVWSAIEAVADAKRIDFRVELADGCHHVRADPDGLRQILTNLFSNAYRYTPDGGSLTLRARCPAGLDAAAPYGRVTVEVVDTGAGIPAQHLPRIFERFYRVDPARSRVEGGTGLGLSIVKHLVEAHGGQVSAESTIGGGTTIRFTLPR
jgi:two-component system, OmpR family, phosphate regulon sensor histidine kinase PhoR